MRSIPNTFGLDVQADAFFEYDSVPKLQAWLAGEKLSQPFLHVGQGSNLLFLDNFKGVILRSTINTVEPTYSDAKKICLRVGAGVVWDEFVSYCVNHGYYGAENLSFVPGQTGAAAVQNIGAYGVEIANLIECVEAMDVHGVACVYTNKQCCYSYRDSLFKHLQDPVFITHVHLTLSKTEHYTLDYGNLRQQLVRYPKTDLATVRKVIGKIRDEKLPDPKVKGNAGSFFVNPIVELDFARSLKATYPDMPMYQHGNKVKLSAAWLIERSGWKGRSLGRAAVYDKQALVLVNNGGATGRDILSLAQAVQQAVYSCFGVCIVPEVKIIG